MTVGEPAAARVTSSLSTFERFSDAASFSGSGA